MISTADPNAAVFEGVVFRAVKSGLVPCTSGALTQLETALLAHQHNVDFNVLRFLHADKFHHDIYLLTGRPSLIPGAQLHCLKPFNL